VKRKTFKSINPLKLTLPDEIFKNLPSLPGVYRMYDKTGDLIYVGKAKSLKARLSSYRNCSPETLPGKVARMIKRVSRIEYEVLASEEEALLKENRLLRSEKPLFNRMNTRTQVYAFISFKHSGDSAELKLFSDIPDDIQDLEFYGAFKAANRVKRALQLIERLHQLRTNSDNLDTLILGERSTLPTKIELKLNDTEAELLRKFLLGFSPRWVRLERKIKQNSNPFLATLWKQAKDELLEFYRFGPRMNARLQKSFSLESHIIEKQELDDLKVKAAFKRRAQD